MANKERFKTAYGERETSFITSGSRYQDTYGYEINKYGQKELVKTGETDLYALIQESLEETKIENILKRVAMGDDTVMRPDGIYADMTEAPKNLIEARQQIQHLENVWNSLPIDTKRKYNMSVEDFIAKSGTQTWLEDMGLLNKPNPEAVPIEAPQETSKTQGGNE